MVVESFRPGVAARLGIGYDVVGARNPGVVYCSISAFGQDGPYATRPAHDLALEAVTGVLSLTLGDDGRPAVPGLPIADLVSALNGTLRRADGAAAARADRARRLRRHRHAWRAVGRVRKCRGSGPDREGPAGRKHRRTTGGSAFYRIYDTRDGRQLVLGGQEPKFVRALLGALGRVDLEPLCLRGPGPHQQPVIDFLREAFLQRDLAEWMTVLARLDVCFAPVNTLAQALDDPNVRARGMLLTDADGRRHLAPAIHFRHEPAAPTLREPLLGEHTAEILNRPMHRPCKGPRL